MWTLIGTSYCTKSYVLQSSLSHKRSPNITRNLQSSRISLFWLPRHKRHCWGEYKRTSDKSTYEKFKQARNQCKKAVKEDRLRYQTKLIDHFVSSPKSVFCGAASTRQAKTAVSQLLVSNRPTNNWPRRRWMSGRTLMPCISTDLH